MTDRPIARVVPRVDAPPSHTCGLSHRAAVVTAGCPGCTGCATPAPAVPR